MPGAYPRWLTRVIVSLTVSLLCLVAATAVVLSRPAWRERARHALGWSTQFVAGTPSGLPSSLTGGADRTVLIFVSDTCAACQRSQPFHRELLGLAGARLAVRVLLTTSNGSIESLAAALGAPADAVIAFDPRGTRLQVVPTVLVVDRAGTVLEMKEGVLPASEQHALIERLKNYLP